MSFLSKVRRRFGRAGAYQNSKVHAPLLRRQPQKWAVLRLPAWKQNAATVRGVYRLPFRAHNIAARDGARYAALVTPCICSAALPNRS